MLNIGLNYSRASMFAQVYVD